MVGVAVVAKRTLQHGIHAHEKASSIAPLKSSCRATWLQTQIEFGSNWARPSGIRHEIVLPVDPWARKQLSGTQDDCDAVAVSDAVESSSQYSANPG